MAEFEVRPAQVGDAPGMARLFAAAAEERDGIATEPPVDIEERTALFTRTVGESAVAIAHGQVIGLMHVEVSRHGFAGISLVVSREWRGRGAGSALVQWSIDWTRARGLHKLCLEVFPHNAAGIALYRKYGFTEEGRRLGQYRRSNGELWDSIVMGRPL